MQAHSLTVSIPPPPRCKSCNGRHCKKYCISQMTWWPKVNIDLMRINLPLIKNFAKISQVTNVMATSKLETTQYWNFLLETANFLGGDHFPFEIQTNGIYLGRHPEKLKELCEAGVHSIAVSIDTLNGLKYFSDLFLAIEETGADNREMSCRICLNITDMIPLELNFEQIFEKISKLPKETKRGRQLLIRNVMVPSNAIKCPQITWIKEHCSQERYKNLYQEFRKMYGQDKEPTEILPFGMEAFSYEGFLIFWSIECLQEKNRDIDVRNIIYHQDGHAYKRWNDPASWIF